MAKFLSSLKRNNAKIREDRAIAISESAELKYKRKIEDLEMELKDVVRDRDNMLDMSPTSADSLVLASEFSADEFINKDLELGLRVRNLTIKIDIAKQRYQELFEEVLPTVVIVEPTPQV